MKGNLENLTALAERVQAMEKVKDDFLVPPDKMFLESDEEVVLREIGQYRMGDVFHDQLATKLRIPRDFYKELPKRTQGARRNLVNNLLLAEKPERRMVRTLEGRARAYLSDRFVPYDNIHMLGTLLPVLQQFPDLRVKSCSLTERKMYVQVVFPSLTGAVKVGDQVAAGITLVNSEVGEGAWDVLEFLEILRCLNGAVGESLMRKYHVGRRAEGGDEGGVFQMDTIKADINAAQLQLRDVVTASLDEVRFQKKLEQLKTADGDRMEDPVLTIERVTKRFGFGPGEQESILKNLLVSGEPTRWGLSNAITAMAHAIENPDRAYEYEKIGGDVVELTPSEWKALAS